MTPTRAGLAPHHAGFFFATPRRRPKTYTAAEVDALSSWCVESLPWDRFDSSKVDRRILAYAKAASLVEANARDYVIYLKNVFRDDASMILDLEGWGAEELRHGAVLRKWAELADPAFAFDDAMAKF